MHLGLNRQSRLIEEFREQRTTGGVIVCAESVAAVSREEQHLLRSDHCSRWSLLELDVLELDLHRRTGVQLQREDADATEELLVVRVTHVGEAPDKSS